MLGYDIAKYMLVITKLFDYILNQIIVSPVKLQVPFSSANTLLDEIITRQHRIVLFNKEDLANPKSAPVCFGVSKC